MTSEVLTSIIVALGGVLGAYITVRVRRSKPRKSEYIDTAFEMYENMVKRQDEEISRLRVDNARKEVIISQQAAELNELKRR